MVMPLLMGGSPSDELRAAQRAALRLIDWKVVLPIVERFACKRGAPPWRAADIAQSLATQLLEGKTTWDPTRQDVARYLMGAAVNAVRLARESAQSRHEVPSGLVDEAPAPTFDGPLAREALQAEALDRLRVALAKDADALAVLDLTIAGVGKSAEQAARLGIPAGRVYDAKDRIVRQGRRIAREQAAASEEEVAE